ncbi:hypothetical protein PM082_022692 [Marasmius tenuissimus]|nr:hypothetical protein PM082_022692 [Marasmius tenuissimus]
MEYATRNSRRINPNAVDEVVPNTGGGKAKASREERQKETDECMSSAVRKSVEGAGELWAFLEMGDESEVKHDTKGETEDEDEWDPNDLVATNWLANSCSLAYSITPCRTRCI